MPKYTCPECEAVLKLAAAVPAGKKIKCASCEHVFKAPDLDEPAEDAPKPKKKKKKAETVATAPPPPPKPPLDDGDSGYGVAEVQVGEDAVKVDHEKVKERWKRSARPKALAAVVAPSNALLLFGLLMGIGCVFFIMVNIWPIVFPEIKSKKADDRDIPVGSAEAEELKKSPEIERKKAKEREEMIAKNTFWITTYVLGLGWASVICLGASKMQNLEAYGLAMTACVMQMIAAGPVAYWFNETVGVAYGEKGLYSILGAVVGGMGCFSSGIYAMRTLLKPEVKAGYEEEAPV